LELVTFKVKNFILVICFDLRDLLIND